VSNRILGVQQGLESLIVPRKAHAHDERCVILEGHVTQARRNLALELVLLDARLSRRIADVMKLDGALWWIA
jgi:hypothetical protein